MTDETTEPQASDSDTAADTAPDTAADTAAEHKPSLKEGFRDGVAKVAGYTVEVASVLAQQGGDVVQAEKDAAEANTEDFIDRIDGEG